jgi:Fe-S cluster assembly iron-binding protein IscA
MFEISERAAHQIAETCRRRRAPAGGYRIRHEGGTEDALKVGFIARPQDGDHVFEHGDAHVYVAADAMGDVDGWILDSRVVEHRTSLYLRRPRPTTAREPDEESTFGGR